MNLKVRRRFFGANFIFLTLFQLFTYISSAQNIYVEPVQNNIKIGALAGNRNLAFGVKNIIQEIISDKDSLFLVENKEKSEFTLQVELIYFDILNTNSGFSVMHKDVSTTVIRMRGILYKNGKKVKQEFAEGKSSEISTSTIIIDEGGKFNQESASSAIKKTIINLLDKLL